jgi:hypothetical protein
MIILAIDLDDTMAEMAYPEIGDPKPYLSFVFRKLKEEGYYIIIWTCRDKTLPIKQWCKKNNVPFDLINQHHPDIFHHYKDDTVTHFPYHKKSKVLADIYIDDKCLFKLPNDWLEIYRLIKQRSAELQVKCLNKVYEQRQSNIKDNA